jgi:RimJ/RimL family protein N-acetyltransferase
VGFATDHRATHVLADGRTVSLRHIQPSDAAELRRAFDRLSPNSRYRRFLAGVHALSEEAIHYLTNVDGVDHVAIVAEIESPNLKEERGVGVARFIRDPNERDRAEAAITVVDDEQHKGIGKLLLAALTEAARERGVHRFTSEVLASNAPMRALLDQTGAVLREDLGETLVYDIALERETLAHDSPLRRILRAASLAMDLLVRRLEPPPLPEEPGPRK